MRWILLILCGLISAYAQASQLNNLLPPVRLAVVNSFGSNLSVRYFNGTVNAIAKAVAPRRLVVQFFLRPLRIKGLTWQLLQAD